MNKRARILLLLSVLAVIAVVVFSIYNYSQTLRHQNLVLATTTSTYDSGLLDYILPTFEKQYNVKVNIISKGTGESIEVAKRGDADLGLVHSRKLEEQFLKDGYGVHRVGVMYNDFIIIGPSDDPTGIAGGSNATFAFEQIAKAGAEGKAAFISRADKSGTNVLELNIWSTVGLEPSNKTNTWYIEAGAGMGAVLRMTNEKNAYTLTDRATWLSFRSQLSHLTVLMEKDRILLNPYALIIVNPENYPQRNFKMALALVKFMISEEGQRLIESFRKENQTLFFPIARDFQLANRMGFPSQEYEVDWYDSQKVELSFTRMIALSSVVRSEFALRTSFETSRFEFDS
jgi:tungstate transport system substrate-binding protein